MVQDPSHPRRIVAGVSTGHLGPTVFLSDDHGDCWREATKPPAFHPGERLKRSLSAVFWLTPGSADEPGVWYAGGSTQGLFRTTDAGDRWSPVDGWNEHPMWETWAEWPEQNTPDGSMLHSIVFDPRDGQHLYLGLSSGGVFESTDGGADWHPLNAGLVSPMFPDRDMEFGQDPHGMRLHPLRPDRLYQQNHCGIYRLYRPGTRWERTTMPRVRIPTPLRSYTNNETWVHAPGTTLDEVLQALDATYPGIRFRAIDEQQKIRKHMRIFINDEIARTLNSAVTVTYEVTLMQAVSGG